jgi:diguanylate cyclase (GGDEF)-like protein
MSLDLENHESFPESFVVEVFSEIDKSTVQQRWREVNVLLRLSILSGLQMQLDATLNMLCDFAGEMVRFDLGMVYFWDEDSQKMHLRVTRSIGDLDSETYDRGNTLNLWATQSTRPLLVSKGVHDHADAILAAFDCSSALVIPLFVNNQVLGSIQLYSREVEAFNREDAQLLWIMSLISENLLNRDYANEGLLRYAFTDFLTAMKTRGYLEQQLDLEIKRAERKKTPLALLMIDIDFFKTLNDTHGHNVGDQVLRDISSILMKDMREIDTVARYGGEEFVILLPETGYQAAKQIANRLRRAVEQANFFAGSPDKVEHLTISIGVAVFDEDAQFKRDLIEAADAALYGAKSQGRNRVVLYRDMPQKERQVS